MDTENIHGGDVGVSYFSKRCWVKKNIL